MKHDLNNLLAQWARAGVNFNIRPSSTTPDLERLLLDTARHASASARLFTMSATWLAEYGETLIARDRLAALITTELELEYLPAMGLLLDTAREATGSLHFNKAIDRCRPNESPAPLFALQQANPKMRALAEKLASPISRKWRLWMQDFEPKYDALRSRTWIAQQNGPEYCHRAMFKGDVRASIMIELSRNPDAGKSILHLARCCSASRPAVTDAIKNLELAGMLRCPRGNNTRPVQLAA